jgi:hypothetical protein
MADVRVDEEELRFKFYYQGVLSLAYNKGSATYGDTHMSRPNFYPVYSPCGREVTTSSAYYENHHRSIFMGHRSVNGVNFWHDNNPTLPSLGDIVFQGADVETCGGIAHLRTTNGWIAKTGDHMLAEQRDISWTPGEQTHVLDVSSTLTSLCGDITFDKGQHGFFGFRVADTIDAEDGGQAVNSRGQSNEQGMRQPAEWVDYSGVVAGQQVGITLMHHPSNPPSPYFVRNYGTVVCSFTINGPFFLKSGESLRQRFRTLVHSGGPGDIDIAGYHADFCKT